MAPHHASGSMGFWLGQTEMERQQELRGQVRNKVKLLQSALPRRRTPGFTDPQARITGRETRPGAALQP